MKGPSLGGAPITTGSGLERAMNCDASNVLPRVFTEGNRYSESGDAMHDYFERISNGATPEESLAQVPEEHRASCEGRNIEGLNLTAYSPEVTLVIDLPTGKGRVLGHGLERDYTGVGPDEVPMTTDLAGVNLEDRTGYIGEHKSGHSRRTPAEENWQIIGPATALADAFELDEVKAELMLHRDDGRPPFISKATFRASDFLVAKYELRALHERTIDNRARYAAGEHIPPTEGTWCRYCPSAWACPAKIATIRAALGFDPHVEIIPADAGKLLAQAKAGIKALESLVGRIYGLAAVTPGGLLLNIAEDGSETYLRDTVTEGNEKLDPGIAIDVAAQVLEVPAGEREAFVRAVAKLEVTKKALDAEVMKRAPKRKGAATQEAIYARIRATPGGASKKAVSGVQQITIRPAGPASDEAA